MPSYDNIWIPTLAAAHVIGICFLLYALEELNGTVTGLTRLVKWYCGCYKGKALQPQDSTDGKEDTQQATEELPPTQKRKKKQQKSLKQHAGVAIDVDPAYPLPVELSWEDVSCAVAFGTASQKTVLHPSSGTFFPCEAVAIMGPSGAGKSTMLDVLAGRKHGNGVEGLVTLNGQPITQRNANKYISYVGQEDVFMPTLSVWESLLFVTQLCMAPLPTKQRNARMESVLETMGLLRVRHTKVGGFLPGGVDVRGLSGGEKRRLSIACGLVGNPSILFLDEPTTGLDSHAALAVMRYLNALTEMGHSVVSTIHQPRQEIFASFDKVLVLSEGYQLFLAPPSYVTRWFSEVLQFPYVKERDGTVADWLISTVAVGFQKPDDVKTRTMSSIEEVKEAAARFVDFVKNLKEGEDAAAKEIDDDDLDTARDNEGTGTPNASTTDGGQFHRGSMGSVVSGSVLSGQTSMAEQHLIWANGQANDSTLEAEPTGKVLENLADTSQPARLYTRSWLVQWWLLSKRSVKHQLRNPAEAAMRILMASWSGTVAGLVWVRLPNTGNSAQERLALLFFAVMMFCMVPFGYMAFPIADRRFFKLDSAKGLYAPSAYFLAYVASNAPFYVMNSCACLLITYGLAGLRYEWWAILQGTTIICLHALVANQFVTMCIWLMQSQDVAFSVATIYISFSLLICGFYIRIRDMTLSVARALSWASFSKYTFQGLALTELKNRSWDYAPCVPVTALPGFQQSAPLCAISSSDVLSYYDYTIPVAICVGALLGFWALTCLISYWALLRIYRKR